MYVYISNIHIKCTYQMYILYIHSLYQKYSVLYGPMKQVFRFCGPLHHVRPSHHVTLGDYKPCPYQAFKFSARCCPTLTKPQSWPNKLWKDRKTHCVRPWGNAEAELDCEGQMISRNTATLNPSGILPLPVSWLWNSTSSEKFEIGYFSGSSKRNATFQNLKISVPGGFS